jgi:flagellar basal-body rod modification protein FlgD
MIGQLGQLNGSTGTTSTTTTASSKMNTIKPEEFLKIMIQEMQQQDPFEPVSSKDLVNQVAQVRDIQSSMDLQATLKDLAISQKLAGAGTMIGKNVTGKTDQGEEVTGVVASVVREGDNVFLELSGGQRLAIGNVLKVVNPAPTTGTATTTASSSTTSSPTIGSFLNSLFGRKA